jgi:hypothetical protein
MKDKPFEAEYLVSIMDYEEIEPIIKIQSYFRMK